MTRSISVNQLHELLKSKSIIDLIDVRTASEYEKLHIAESELFPLDHIGPEAIATFQQKPKDNLIYFICHSGSRARSAAEKMAKAGVSQAVVVDGGMEAWSAAGFPVEGTPSGIISLDRQLRIAFGVLVLSGVVLSRLVHPNWIWLSGFVGAGLIFAGLSNICLLQTLMAKMPWNQASPSACPKCESH